MPLVNLEPEPQWTVAEDRLRDALHYLVTLSETGVTAGDINAFIADRYFRWLDLTPAGLAPFFTDPRSIAQRLVDLRWAVDDGAFLRATDVARALDRASRREAVANVIDHGVREVTLSRDDPLVWAELITKLGALGPFLLVDRYFDWKLLERFPSTGLARLLVGRELEGGGQGNRLAGLESALQVIYGPSDTPIEVRVAPKHALHDRFIVSKAEVWSIGTSLNGIGRTTTLLTPHHDAAPAIRAEVERIWTSADVLWVSSP